MAKGKSISSKREVPPYENKAVAPLVVDCNIRIVVVKEHDGLEVGECYVKDVNTAAKMVALGFWMYE